MATWRIYFVDMDSKKNHILLRKSWPEDLYCSKVP